MSPLAAIRVGFYVALGAALLLHSGGGALAALVGLISLTLMKALR